MDEGHCNSIEDNMTSNSALEITHVQDTQKGCSACLMLRVNRYSIVEVWASANQYVSSMEQKAFQYSVDSDDDV